MLQTYKMASKHRMVKNYGNLSVTPQRVVEAASRIPQYLVIV